MPQSTPRAICCALFTLLGANSALALNLNNSSVAIQVNGVAGSVLLNDSGAVNISLSQAIDDLVNQPADWWLVAETSANGWHYLTMNGFRQTDSANPPLPQMSPMFQGNAASLTNLTLLNVQLPNNTRTLYYGLDFTQDSRLPMDASGNLRPDNLIYDSIGVRYSDDVAVDDISGVWSYQQDGMEICYVVADSLDQLTPQNTSCSDPEIIAQGQALPVALYVKGDWTGSDNSACSYKKGVADSVAISSDQASADNGVVSIQFNAHNQASVTLTVSDACTTQIDITRD